MFPDRTYTAGITNTDRYDIDWALAAPETVAWNQASNWMYSVYGFGFLVWMLNMGIDNNGGNLHEFFWRVTQAFQVVPLMQAYLAWKVLTSYSFDYYSESVNITAEGTAKQNRDQMYRRYAIDNTSFLYEDGYFDEHQVSAQWTMMMSVVVFTLVQNSAYPHIAQAFHEKRVEADLLAAQDEAAH